MAEAGAGDERASAGERASVSGLDDLALPKLAIDPRRAQLASIAGTVRDQKGAPIAGALVCARTRTNKLASVDSRRASCSTSERDGHYLIEGLFGVRHSVTASARGYVAEAFHRGEFAARRDTVDLRPGVALTDIDIVLEGGGVELRGVVKDLSGGEIEGALVTAGAAMGHTAADGRFSLWVRPGGAWVTAEADGYAPAWEEGATPGHVFELFLTPESVLIGKVVRAADGAPVEGARVTAESGGGMNFTESTADTDAGGNFRLDGLKPGPYKAKAVADDAYGLADEQVILGLGETSEPVTILAHPAFFIAGNVVVGGGDGACDDGWVTLADRANNRKEYGHTEADGAVRVRGLLPGEYSIEVRCEGFVAADTYEKVELVDKSVDGQRWEVTRGRSIRGVVVDGAGEPVPRINVSASAKPDPSKPRAHQTNTWGGETDADGRFELAGLLPGEYLISMNAWQPSRATPAKPTSAILAEGKDLEGLRLELPATGEIKGSVRDGQGRPIPRANINLSDGVNWQSAAAGDDGTFRFPYVAAGEYRVTAQRGWGDEMRAPGTSDDDVQGEKVAVRAGSVEEVKLIVERSDGRITGVVHDADGGPLADAFIESTHESDSAAKSAGQAMRDGRWGSFWQTPELTDADGRFVLEDLQAGKHTLRAHRKGGGEAILEHVEVGGEVVLTIAEASRMSGTVSLAGSGAPEEFTVTARDEATGFARTDQFFRSSGAWSLAELPAGNYKVRVDAGAGTAEVTAAVAAGKDTSGVRVELAPKVTARGKVVDLEGKPVPGLRVTISADSGGAGFIIDMGGEAKQNITDASGAFEIQHAPTGKVRVMVMPRSWEADDYGWTALSSVIPATGAAVDLPAIKVSKKRVKQDEAAGDFGYSLKQSEPGDDPLLRRSIVAVVRPGSAAAAGGMKPGDEIVSVDGNDVTGANSYLLYSLTQVLAGTVVNFGLASGTTLAIPAGRRP